MGPIEGRLLRPLLWSALLTVTMLSPGCRTGPETTLFTVSGPGWRVQQGQALWRPRQKSPELGGDLVVASHADGRCVVQFSKTPLPLVLAQTTGTNWLIQFPPQQMGFIGGGSGPTRFPWLYLRPALAGEPLPSPLRFERRPDGNWRLENTRTGETLEGFLAP
jgi:hypothetical protein